MKIQYSTKEPNSLYDELIFPLTGESMDKDSVIQSRFTLDTIPTIMFDVFTLRDSVLLGR